MIPSIDPEFRGLIPPLLVDEFNQLEQNILSCGRCRDAIILWDGVIVDGHNRFEICVKHGIEFKITEMEFASREAVMVWILENQLGRRNLSDAARIELALAKAEMLRERARRKQSQAGGDKKSAESLRTKTSNSVSKSVDSLNVLNALADDAGVGRGTIQRYMELKESGNPELVSRVKSGELKIGTAHRMLGKEVLKQLDRADKMYEYIHANLQNVLKDATEAEASAIDACLSGLSRQIDALISKLEDSKCKQF